MKYTVSLIVVIAWCLMGSVDVRAHHSGSRYARSTIEIEGTLSGGGLAEPARAFLRSCERREREGVVTWDIEANSLSILRRTDANPDNLKMGDTVKVAGAPSRQAAESDVGVEHPRGEWTRNRARSWHHAALDEE